MVTSTKFKRWKYFIYFLTVFFSWGSGNLVGLFLSLFIFIFVWLKLKLTLQPRPTLKLIVLSTPAGLNLWWWWPSFLTLESAGTTGVYALTQLPNIYFKYPYTGHLIEPSLDWLFWSKIDRGSHFFLEIHFSFWRFLPEWYNTIFCYKNYIRDNLRLVLWPCLSLTTCTSHNRNSEECQHGELHGDHCSYTTQL